MIHIYQPPTEKNPTIGFSFYHFRSETFGKVHEKCSSLEKVKEAFVLSQREILAANLEAFWEYCDKSVTEKNITFSEAIKQVQDIVSSGVDVKTGFENMKKAILSKDFTSFRVMVKNLPPEKKEDGIFMAATVVKYLKEVD